MNDVATRESPRIEIPAEQIRDFCERNHIRFLALFGSVLRDDFGENSDIDVLVEFEPDHIPGLQFFAMQEELSRILGREVDMNTPGFLGAHMRKSVQDEALIQYVKA